MDEVVKHLVQIILALVTTGGAVVMAVLKFRGGSSTAATPPADAPGAPDPLNQSGRHPAVVLGPTPGLDPLLRDYLERQLQAEAEDLQPVTRRQMSTDLEALSEQITTKITTLDETMSREAESNRGQVASLTARFESHTESFESHIESDVKHFDKFDRTVSGVKTAMSGVESAIRDLQKAVPSWESPPGKGST